MDLVHPSEHNFPMWGIHPCDNLSIGTWSTIHVHTPPSPFPYIATEFSYFQDGTTLVPVLLVFLLLLAYLTNASQSPPPLPD